MARAEAAVPVKERPSPRDENRGPGPVIASIWKEGTYEYNLMDEIREPFDQEELVRLADAPSRDTRRFTELIARAAAEEDSRFLYLLDRDDLREEPTVELALAAYDYSVNGNPQALEFLLDKHAEEAKETSGWDLASVWVLGYVNEWDLTKKAFGSYPLSGDGAGGDARYAFWLRRKALFPGDNGLPDDYEQFRKEMAAQQWIAR